MAEAPRPELPAKVTVSGRVPGGGAVGRATVARPVGSVTAVRVWLPGVPGLPGVLGVPRVKVRVCPGIGLPLAASVRRALRVRASAVSAAAGPV
ncbi:MAG: hypothetical protein M3O15_00900 [Acidobacteriota bacterium]|nr:hypothetical protein [Acidobacteriota bacterium]